MAPRKTLIKPLIASIVAALALMGTVSFAYQGGFDGGGGNLCYSSQGQPHLLEFADLAASLTEPGVQFEATAMTRLYGFGEFTPVYASRIKERVDAILMANEKLSPILVSWLRLAAQQTQFSFVAASIDVPVRADTRSQSLCRDSDVRASVLYFPPLLAFADLAQINRLDLESQSGLVIHEAGRFVQMWLGKVDQQKAQKAALASDAGLQDMVRTLFDVYRGVSHESVDDENLIAALEDLILIHDPSGDLCLSNYFYNQARRDVQREKTEMQFNNAVTMRQRQQDLAKPELLKQACQLESTQVSWADYRNRLLTLKARAAKPAAEGITAEVAAALSLEIDKTLKQPLPGKSLRTAVLEAMPGVIGKFSSQLAGLQLKISTAGVIASAYEANQQRWLPQVDFQRTEAIACRSRENLKAWLKIGAPALNEGPLMNSLAEMLNRPNPNCRN